MKRLAGHKMPLAVGASFRGLRFATLLAPCNRPLYEQVASWCDALSLADLDDWRELAGSRVDVAFVCSPPLLWLEGAVEAIAAPVLTDARFGGEALYTSEVVVRADSAFRCFDELSGRRWAVNEPSSWSGYWVILRRAGDWTYFGSVTQAGSHQRALRMVVAGEVDAAAIDCHVLSRVLALDPPLATRLRVIETLGPVPSQPVIVRRDLGSNLKRALTDRILSMPPHLLRPHQVECFAPAPDYREVAEFVSGRGGIQRPSGGSP